MKTLKKYIEPILKEELLKGNLPQLEKYLLANYKSNITHNEEKELVDKVFNKIMIKKQKIDEIEKKLNNAKLLNSFGELIYLLMIKNEIQFFDIYKVSKIEESILQKLIKNRIDITKVDLKSLVKLTKHFNIKLDIALLLLEKSIKLFQMKPSVLSAIARYSHDKGQEDRNISMRDALNELVLKASEKKHFEHETLIKTNISKEIFIKMFEKEYKKDGNS